MNRDPIGERGGHHLYGFVSNQPIVRADPFGLTYSEEAIQFVSLAELRQRSGSTRTHGWTPWASHWTPVVFVHWIEEESGGCCARVKCAKPLHVSVRTLIANDIVGSIYTQEGFNALVEHENRRREAYRRGYATYIAPVSEQGEQAMKCGRICRPGAGEAKRALLEYLDDIQRDAISRYERYELRQQAGITFEDMEGNISMLNGLRHGYRSVHAIAAPGDASNPPTNKPCPWSYLPRR